MQHLKLSGSMFRLFNLNPAAYKSALSTIYGTDGVKIQLPNGKHRIVRGVSNAPLRARVRLYVCDWKTSQVLREANRAEIELAMAGKPSTYTFKAGDLVAKISSENKGYIVMALEDKPKAEPAKPAVETDQEDTGDLDGVAIDDDADCPEELSELDADTDDLP